MYQLALNGTTPINVTFVNRAVKFVDGPLDYTKNLLFNVTLPLAPRIPARSMHLFRLHTVLQVAIHYYGLLILHLLSTSMLAWLAHDAATATAAMEVQGRRRFRVSLACFAHSTTSTTGSDRSPGDAHGPRARRGRHRALAWLVSV